eukprot:6467950-Amphidinium_carterae.1
MVGKARDARGGKALGWHRLSRPFWFLWSMGVFAVLRHVHLYRTPKPGASLRIKALHSKVDKNVGCVVHLLMMLLLVLRGNEEFAASPLTLAECIAHTTHKHLANYIFPSLAPNRNLPT